MRLPLDTHSFLWAVAGSRLLKPAVRRLIESADEVYVSAASIWEVAIKARLGKIHADPRELTAAIKASGFVELPVSALHAAGVAQLAPRSRLPTYPLGKTTIFPSRPPCSMRACALATASRAMRSATRGLISPRLAIPNSSPRSATNQSGCFLRSEVIE